MTEPEKNVGKNELAAGCFIAGIIIGIGLGIPYGRSASIHQLEQNYWSDIGEQRLVDFLHEHRKQNPSPAGRRSALFIIASPRVDGTVGEVKAARTTLMAVLLHMTLVLRAGHGYLPCTDVRT